MLRTITKILLFLLLTIGIYAQEGLAQKHLVSVSPKASATGVPADTAVEIRFDLPIIANSVKQNTITLNTVKGTTALAGERTLRFTPDESLKSGTYEVNVKPVKLQTSQEDNGKHRPKTLFEKFIHWLCSLIYDDPAKCPLCKKLCKNSSNTIKTQKINYTFSVEDDTPTIKTITLNKTEIELQEGNETALAVTAKYDDNTTQDVSSDVEWVVGDASIVSVTNGMVKALKEGVTTIKAKYEGKTSDALTVTVVKKVEIINGYTLPPEPDPAVNNATLLGVDSNGNGVRDDVERWIITHYAKDPQYPKTKTAIAMQYAWASQKILENPTMESSQYEDDALACESYWLDQKTKGLSGFEYGQFSKKHGVFGSYELKDRIYNTRKRIERKFSYNTALGGNILVDEKDDTLNRCQTNIDELGE